MGAVGKDQRQVPIVFKAEFPADAPRLMKELVDWLQEAQKVRQLHPLLIVGIFALGFLEIHPFQDGNGRLCRTLTTLLLLRAGYAYVPYSSLENVIESNVQACYRALWQTQSTIRTSKPNWQPWLTFFLKALRAQKRRLETKVQIELPEVASIPRVAILILDYVRQHGRVTVAEMVAATGISRNTLKDHFFQLVANRRLILHGSGRASWYSTS